MHACSRPRGRRRTGARDGKGQKTASRESSSYITCDVSMGFTNTQTHTHTHTHTHPAKLPELWRKQTEGLTSRRLACLLSQPSLCALFNRLTIQTTARKRKKKNNRGNITRHKKAGTKPNEQKSAGGWLSSGGEKSELTSRSRFK